MASIRSGNYFTISIFILLLLSYHRRLRMILRMMVLGRHAGESQVVGRMSGDAGAFAECVGNTLITPDRTTIQVRSSG